MFSKPDWVLPWSGSRMVRSPPSEKPRLGLRRLENSPLMFVWRNAGPSSDCPNRMKETVGSDSSSATNGSSMASVAGKNRWPIIPWAPAPVALVSRTTMTAR